jgi:hypothetical protein
MLRKISLSRSQKADAAGKEDAQQRGASGADAASDARARGASLGRRLSFSRSAKSAKMAPDTYKPTTAEGMLFEGYLKKRSVGQKSAFKNWRVRWITLAADGVVTWHKEPGAAASGSIALGPASTATTTSGQLVLGSRLREMNELTLVGPAETLRALADAAASLIQTMGGRASSIAIAEPTIDLSEGWGGAGLDDADVEALRTELAEAKRSIALARAEASGAVAVAIAEERANGAAELAALRATLADEGQARATAEAEKAAASAAAKDAEAAAVLQRAIEAERRVAELEASLGAERAAAAAASSVAAAAAKADSVSAAAQEETSALKRKLAEAEASARQASASVERANECAAAATRKATEAEGRAAQAEEARKRAVARADDLDARLVAAAREAADAAAKAAATSRKLAEAEARASELEGRAHQLDVKKTAAPEAAAPAVVPAVVRTKATAALQAPSAATSERAGAPIARSPPPPQPPVARAAAAAAPLPPTSKSGPHVFRVGTRVLAIAPDDDEEEEEGDAPAEERWVPGRVLGERVFKGSKQYKISLDGYNSEDDAWVDHDDERVRPYEAPNSSDDAEAAKAEQGELDRARKFAEARKAQANQVHAAAARSGGVGMQR